MAIRYLHVGALADLGLDEAVVGGRDALLLELVAVDADLDVLELFGNVDKGLAHDFDGGRDFVDFLHRSEFYLAALCVFTVCIRFLFLTASAALNRIDYCALSPEYVRKCRGSI